jgi:hypothetical protein
MAIARLRQQSVQVVVVPTHPGGEAARQPAVAPNTGPVMAAPGAPAPVPEPTVAAASSMAAPPSLMVIVGSFVAIAIALVIAYFLSKSWDKDFDKAAAAAAGLNVFALFYVVAQAIERLLEPISNFIYSAVPTTNQRDQKVAAFLSAPQGNTARQAADAQAALDTVRANRAVIFWAMATIISMGASAWFKLYFLHLVGITSIGRVPELLATGLIIGSGTKPLHDLISRIQKSSTNASDPAETSSSG